MYPTLSVNYPGGTAPTLTRTAAVLDELKMAVRDSYKALTAAMAGAKTVKADAKTVKANTKTAHRAFADACFALYQNRAQGDKSGKGFSRALKDAGICRMTAYRAMWRYNLVTRVTKPKPSAKVSRLSLKTLAPLVEDPAAFGAELTGLLQAALGVAFVVEVRLP